MFEGSPVASIFSMASDKVLYVLRHGVAPVVRNELVKYVQESGCMFTILLDETKQLPNK